MASLVRDAVEKVAHSIGAGKKVIRPLLKRPVLLKTSRNSHSSVTPQLNRAAVQADLLSQPGASNLAAIRSFVEQGSNGAVAEMPRDSNEVSPVLKYRDALWGSARRKPDELGIEEFAEELGGFVFDASLQHKAAELLGQSVAKRCMCVLASEEWQGPTHVSRSVAESRVGICGRVNPSRRIKSIMLSGSDMIQSEVRITPRRSVVALTDGSGALPSLINHQSCRYCHLIVSHTAMAASQLIASLSAASLCDRGRFAVSVAHDAKAPATHTVSIDVEGLTNDYVKEALGRLTAPAVDGLRVQLLGFYSYPCSLYSDSDMCYQLLLRDVQSSGATVKHTLEASLRAGFLNFFGVRHFGDATFRTFHVAHCVRQRRFALALWMLTHNAIETDGNAQLWHQRGAEAGSAAIAAYPWITPFVQQLARDPHDVAAFQSIYDVRVPLVQRMAHKTAIECVVWNVAASLRWYMHTRNSQDRLPSPSDLVQLERPSVRSQCEMKWGLLHKAGHDNILPKCPSEANRQEVIQVGSADRAAQYDPQHVVLPLATDAYASPTVELARRFVPFASLPHNPSYCCFRPLIVVPGSCKVLVLPERADEVYTLQMDVQCQRAPSQRRVFPLGCGVPLTQRIEAVGGVPLLSSRATTTKFASRCVALQFSIPSVSYASSLLRESVQLATPPPASAHRSATPSEAPSKGPRPETEKNAAVSPNAKGSFLSEGNLLAFDVKGITLRDAARRSMLFSTRRSRNGDTNDSL